MMSDGTDIDFLHGIVRYILGKTTDEGKAVMKAADEIERLEAVLEDAEQRVKDVQCVCDHNQAQIKRQFAELKQANAVVEAAREWQESCETLIRPALSFGLLKDAKLQEALAALETDDG